MGVFLLKTPMNHRAKFDAASFILGGEIQDRTNTDTKKTHKQSPVTDISTPCLSACMDKNATDFNGEIYDFACKTAELISISIQIICGCLAVQN